MYDQNFKSRFGLKGTCKLVLTGPDGKVKDARTIKDVRITPNTITTFGDKLVADRMSDAGLAAISHMAIGTGSGQGASDNSLATELDRNAIDSNTQGSGAADNDIVIVGSWAAGDGTGAITEAGIFNDASAAGMFCYADFAAVNKGASDTLTINWTITFGAS